MITIVKVVITKIVVTKLIMTNNVITMVVVAKIILTKVVTDKYYCWKKIIILIVINEEALLTCSLVRISYRNYQLIDLTFCQTQITL